MLTPGRSLSLHAESGKELMCLQGHLASVTCVAATADGRYAVSGSLDRTVRLWDLGGE